MKTLNKQNYNRLQKNATKFFNSGKIEINRYIKLMDIIFYNS